MECAPEFKNLADAIKSALDPNGIFAPGKYGIGSTTDARVLRV
jgi:hypothetical protein